MEMKNYLTLFLTFLFSLAFVNGVKVDKQDCGKTKSCFSIPPTCQSSADCDYLLKYSVNGSDMLFEFASKKYQWVAVGFNTKNGMLPGKALICESHSDTVMLNRYSMDTRTPQKTGISATLLTSVSDGGVMKQCSFTRKIAPGGDSFNLSLSLHFLYAAGMMSGSTIHEHKIYDSSLNAVDVSVITDNSEKPRNNTPASKRIDTSTCGKDKICLRNPESCNDNTDCDYLVAIKKTGSTLEFSLSGKSDGYVAVGFNDKARMGGTEVIVCYRQSGSVKYGTATLEYSSPNLKQSSDIALLEGGDGGTAVYCKFTRPININNGLDLGVSRYLIFAKGRSGTSKIKKHKGSGSKGCSSEKVDFTSNAVYKLGDCKGGSTIPKVHGSLMLFVWLFLAVLAMFIARYSRSLWGGKKIMGIDVWFQLHRLFMFVAILLVVVSIIMIFVYEKGWSESAGDHAVFGIVVLVLAILQPSFAFFRPHPGTPRRFIFNWIHRFGALAIVIFALVTLFQGAELVKDDGGKVVGKLIIVLIVIAVVTALVLEFLAFRVRKQANQYVAEHTSGTPGTLKVKETQSFWEQNVQRVLLAVLSVVSFVLVVIMMAFVSGAGDDGHHSDSEDDHSDDEDDD